MSTNSLRSDQFGLSPNVFEDAVAFIEAVRHGISGKVVKLAVEQLGNRDLLVRVLGTTGPNLSRYYSKKSLSREDSEEVLDTIRLYLEALRVWGSDEAAREWLNSKVPALNGEAPINLFDTFEGRRWVHQVLQMIEFGEFS